MSVPFRVIVYIKLHLGDAYVISGRGTEGNGAAGAALANGNNRGLSVYYQDC